MNYGKASLIQSAIESPPRGDPFDMGMLLLACFATRNNSRKITSCVSAFVSRVRVPYRL